MDNLWGDLSSIEKLRTPQKILNEQASYLNSKMKNKVIASLIKSEKNHEEMLIYQEYDFKFDFVLTSPSIKGYKYRMFGMYHNVQIYPMYVRVEEAIEEEIGQGLLNITKSASDGDIDTKDLKSNYDYKILDEETFVSFLELVLSCKTVKRVISSLISLADTI